VVDAVLADWRSAPIDEGLRATLGFLQKLTLDPAGVEAVDVEEVRAAGVSDDALDDAIHVCVLFNIIDRIADALGFEVPDLEYSERVAPGFLAGGYAEPASWTDYTPARRLILSGPPGRLVVDQDPPRHGGPDA
jgi:hypothetical protein